MTTDNIWKDNMIDCHERSLDQPLSRRFYLYYSLPRMKYQTMADLATIKTTLLEIMSDYSDEYQERMKIYDRICLDLERLCEQ